MFNWVNSLREFLVCLFSSDNLNVLGNSQHFFLKKFGVNIHNLPI